LEVNHLRGRTEGEHVIVNPGGPNEEHVMIVAFGSLVIHPPLKLDHQVGEIIRTDAIENARVVTYKSATAEALTMLKDGSMEVAAPSLSSQKPQKDGGIVDGVRVSPPRAAEVEVHKIPSSYVEMVKEMEPLKLDPPSPKLEYVPPPMGLKIPIELDPPIKNVEKPCAPTPVQIVKLSSLKKIDVVQEKRKEMEFQMESLKVAVGEVDVPMEVLSPTKKQRPVAKKRSPKKTLATSKPAVESGPKVKVPASSPKLPSPQREATTSKPSPPTKPEEPAAVEEDGGGDFDFFVEEETGGDQSANMPEPELEVAKLAPVVKTASIAKQIPDTKIDLPSHSVAPPDRVQQQIKSLGKAPRASPVVESTTRLYDKAPLLDKYEAVAEDASQDRIIVNEFKQEGKERAFAAASLLQKPFPEVLHKTEKMTSAAKQARKEELSSAIKKVEAEEAPSAKKSFAQMFARPKPKPVPMPAQVEIFTDSSKNRRRKAKPNSKLAQPEVMRFQDDMMLKPYEMMRKPESLPQWGDAGGMHNGVSDDNESDAGSENGEKKVGDKMDMSFLYQMDHVEEYSKFPPLVVTEHPSWRKFFHIAEEDIRNQARAEFFPESELDKQQRLLRQRQVALSKAAIQQESPKHKDGAPTLPNDGTKMGSALWREQRNQRKHDLENGGQSIVSVGLDGVTHDQVLGNEWKYYRLDLLDEHKRNVLSFELDIHEGDADLFISCVTIPSALDYQWKSTAAGLHSDRVVIFPDNPKLKNRNGPLTFYIGIFGAADMPAPYSFVCSCNRIEIQEGEPLEHVGKLICKLNGLNVGTLNLDGEVIEKKVDQRTNKLTFNNARAAGGGGGEKHPEALIIKSAEESLKQLERELELGNLQDDEDALLIPKDGRGSSFTSGLVIDSSEQTPRNFGDLEESISSTNGTNDTFDSQFHPRLLSPHLIEMMKFEDEKIGNEDDRNGDDQYSDTESVDEGEVDRCLNNYGDQQRAHGIGVWTEKVSPEISTLRNSSSLPHLGGRDGEVAAPHRVTAGDYALMKKRAGVCERTHVDLTALYLTLGLCRFCRYIFPRNEKAQKESDEIALEESVSCGHHFPLCEFASV
jgi:hypothetical protein